ncbi:hypothetical protein NL676_015378 [Syzygium grande]|nr:hypothetical protein NL676_015378 [Syzygium grande]
MGEATDEAEATEWFTGEGRRSLLAIRHGQGFFRCFNRAKAKQLLLHISAKPQPSLLQILTEPWSSL